MLFVIDAVKLSWELTAIRKAVAIEPEVDKLRISIVVALEMEPTVSGISSAPWVRVGFKILAAMFVTNVSVVAPTVSGVTLTVSEEDSVAVKAEASTAFLNSVA